MSKLVYNESIYHTPQIHLKVQTKSVLTFPSRVRTKDFYKKLKYQQNYTYKNDKVYFKNTQKY
jgi:hypothetical protein